MTDPPAIAQESLQCTACAGQCAFDPASGDLLCQSCGTYHTILIDPDADPAHEQHYHPDLPHTEQPRVVQDRTFACGTCGGEVVFHGHALSVGCPYCQGPLVAHAQDEVYDTLGIVPFSVSGKAALRNAHRWISGRWAAPNGLPQAVAGGRMVGIYVPFWTFDSHEAVDYTVTYRAKAGKRTVIRTMAGFMRTAFDDLLMPASPHVTPLIRDGILHEFNPDELRPFDPAYLAGFAAERHHQSVREGLAQNEDDKALLLRNRIKRHSGKNRIVRISYKTDTTGIKYRRILLPVWLLHYEWDGQPMKIATCGLHGRTFGERPYSTGKLFKLATVLAAAVAALGFLWGAAQIY